MFDYYIQWWKPLKNLSILLYYYLLDYPRQNHLNVWLYGLDLTNTYTKLKF